MTSEGRDVEVFGLRGVRLNSIVSLGLGTILGAVLVLGFPPYDLPALGLLAVPALLVFTMRMRSAHAVLLGLGAAISFFGIHLRWVAAFGWYALIALVLLQALFFCAFFGIAQRILKHRTVPAALATGGAWALIESARGSIPFGGFPWATLGSSLHSFAWARRIAALVGTTGVSALIIVASSLVVLLFLPRAFEDRSPRMHRMKPALMLSVLVTMPLFLSGNAERGGRTVTIAIVQAGIETPWYEPADPREVLNRHVRLTRKLKGRSIDLVMWGENVIETLPARQVLPLLSEEIGAPIAAGAVEDTSSGGWLNLVVATSGDLELGRYAKQHPVPFGEYVPLRSLLGRLPVLAREVPRDMTRGGGPTMFNYGRFTGTPVVSYESALPAITRQAARSGADILQVHTNNSSFGRSAASSQHLSLDQMRAAELGMPVARAAITGISASIDAGGEIIDSMALFENGVIVSRIQIPSTSTPYRRFGDLLLTLPLQVWGVAFLTRRWIRQMKARD